MQPGLHEYTDIAYIVPTCHTEQPGGQAAHIVQLLHAAAVDDDDDRAPQQEGCTHNQHIPAVAQQLALACSTPQNNRHLSPKGHPL